MKGLKTVLTILGLCCLLAFPFVAIPWSVLARMYQWFGVEPIPDAPVIVVTLRATYAVVGMAGIYFLILARDPLRYAPLLILSSFGLTLLAFVVLVVGVLVQLPPFIYMGKALFFLIFARLIAGKTYKIVKAREEQEQEEKEEREEDKRKKREEEEEEVVDLEAVSEEQQTS